MPIVTIVSPHVFQIGRNASAQSAEQVAGGPSLHAAACTVELSEAVQIVTMVCNNTPFFGVQKTYIPRAAGASQRISHALDHRYALDVVSAAHGLQLHNGIAIVGHVRIVDAV